MSSAQHWIGPKFRVYLAETARAMKVADGFEPGAVIGPLIDMKAVEKVEAHIADAVKKGAKVVTGGKRSAIGGTFFEPTVLTDVTTDMVITKEETFGPTAPLYRFKTDAEAVKIADGWLTGSSHRSPRVRPSRQTPASVHPSSLNSTARSGASATEKNSSSCGGGTDVPLSIACAWPR